MFRQRQPSATVIDSQTVKAPGEAARGYDANKKIIGAQAPHYRGYGGAAKRTTTEYSVEGVTISIVGLRIFQSIRRVWKWTADTGRKINNLVTLFSTGFIFYSYCRVEVIGHKQLEG